MSHELRTPLNAILGFSEVMAERMFGEVNDKQAEYLQDILSSGRHLLSRINDILDLSKVEAGRLELELGQFHLPTALDNFPDLDGRRSVRAALRSYTTVMLFARPRYIRQWPCISANSQAAYAPAAIGLCLLTLRRHPAASASPPIWFAGRRGSAVALAFPQQSWRAR
jgi:signal transduction histidine kinase